VEELPLYLYTATNAVELQLKDTRQLAGP